MSKTYNIQESVNKVSLEKTNKILEKKKKDSIIIKLLLENKLDKMEIEDLVKIINKTVVK